MNPTVRYDLLPGEWRPDAPRVSYTADRSQIAALLEEALRAQPWTSGEADAGPSVTVKGSEPVDELEHRFGVHHSPNTMVRRAQMWMGPDSSPRCSIGLTVGASDSARTVRASLSTLARLMLR